MKKYRPRGMGSLHWDPVRKIAHAKIYIAPGLRKSITIHAKNQADANRILQEKVGAIQKDGPRSYKADRITVSEVLDALTTSLRIRKRSEGLSDVEVEKLEPQGAKRLREFFGQMKASKVSGNTIESYIEARLKMNSPRPATLNHEIKTLRHAYNLAIKRGLISNAPTFELLPVNNARQGFFEQDQYETIRKYLPPWFQVLCDVAIVTGIRRGELAKIKRDQVDFKAGKNGRINLEPADTKNKTGRFFPLTIELRAILEKQLSGVPTEYVFHYEDGTPILNNYGRYNSQWKIACEKAFEETKDARFSKKHFHDFRRTAVRNFVRSGIQTKVAMKFSGHKTESIFQRYNILNEEDLENAIELLEKNGPRKVQKRS